MNIRNKKKSEINSKKDYGSFKHKYQCYVINQIIIWAIVIVLGIFLFLYHQFNVATEDVYEFTISFFAMFGLDLSIVLIPAILAINNIRKQFKEEKKDLKNLRARLMNLRYEVVYNLVSKYEQNNEQVIKRMKQFSNPVFLSPFIIDKIIVNLRKFHLEFASNRSYADIFNFKFRAENFSDLYSLDKIIIGAIELLKNYGDKKEYNVYRDIYILKELNETEDHLEIRNNFLMDFGYVIAYEIFFKKEEKRKLVDIYCINYKGNM